MNPATPETPTSEPEPIPDFITNWREIDQDVLTIQELLALSPGERVRQHQAIIDSMEILRGSNPLFELAPNPKAFKPPPG